MLSTLARTAHVGALTGEARERWTRALDAYRHTREALTADAASDWQRPSDALAVAIRGRRAGEAEARALLDAALGPLARSGEPYTSAPLPGGALLLAYAPVRSGWIAFAATRQRVRAVPFVLPDPSAGREALAAALLAPFESEISRADEVLLAPQGVVRSIDIHGLPHAGSTLVARLPVRYVLDVHEAPHAPDEEGAPAVVIADPTADLASARAEGLDVLAALTASARWPVLGWSGLDATAARLATELPRAALLHFAGHGVYAGREGWDSALPLARGARWSVGDVLASRRAPTRVVLSACEGARSSFEAAEGLGLAQAFLVAGAQSVIAPTRAVKDELAQAFARAFYASLLRPGARDGTPATALREAQIAIAAAQPDADWAAFRALSP